MSKLENLIALPQIQERIRNFLKNLFLVMTSEPESGEMGDNSFRPEILNPA